MYYSPARTSRPRNYAPRRVAAVRLCPRPCGMASTSSDVGLKQTDAPATQPAGTVQVATTPADDWPVLARRCEALGITRHDLQIEHDGVEVALAAIGELPQSAAYKKKQRQKLRKRVLRAVANAQAALAELSCDAMDTEKVSCAVRGGLAPPPAPPHVNDATAASSSAVDARIDMALASNLFVPGTEHRGWVPVEQIQAEVVDFQNHYYYGPAMHQWRMHLRPTELEDADHDVLLSSLEQLSDAERAHFHTWRRQRGLFMLLTTFEQWEDWQEVHEAEFEAELLDQCVQAWSLNGMAAQPQMHTTTWAELLEQSAGPRQPGESDAAYQARASEILSQRSEPLPPPPPSRHLDGQTDDYYDGGAEDIWCMSCNEERPGERGLSRVARDARGEPVRVFLRRCRRCDRGVDQL